MHRYRALILLIIPVLWQICTPPAMAEDIKIVFHVDEADPAKHALVLNNVVNTMSYYMDQGEVPQIEIVAYGPGLTMLTAGKSKVEERIAGIRKSTDDVQFSACGNTMHAIKNKTGKEVSLLPDTVIVTSGVARLVELQRQGYAYIRP